MKSAKAIFFDFEVFKYDWLVCITEYWLDENKELKTKDSKTKKEENLFNVVLDCWNAADKDLDDFYFWACIILKYCIEQEGIQPFIQGCVHCESTRVETLSVKDGGFLCEKCNHNQYPKWSVEQLKKYRALFKCKEENLEYVKDHFNFNLDDLIYLAKWMEYHTHKNYPSIRFLESIRGLK